MAQVALDCMESCRRSGLLEAVSVDVPRSARRRLGRLDIGNIVSQLRLLALLLRELARPGTALAHLHASVGTPLTVMKNLQLAALVRRAGIPLLLHPHSGRMEELIAAAKARPGGRWRGLMGRLLASADGVVVMSPGWQALLAREWPTARLHVLESGVDTQAYAPSAQGWASPPRVLSMGQWAAHKGLAELSAAWGRLGANPDYGRPELHMLGEARDDQGRDLAAAIMTQPGVFQHGVVTGAAKIAMLQAARIYVMPSHYENLPVALLEAMACGAACIASSVGAVPEVLAGGAGVCVPPRDPAALEAALGELLLDERRCRELAAAGRQRVVEHYSRQRFDAELSALYGTLARLNPG
jgi:glycosyltransferase involved in cell wall biosynthesis